MEFSGIKCYFHGRTKRGRGAVGSRMDETGSYLPSHSNVDYSERPQRRAVLGPEKPYSLLSSDSSEDDDSSPELRKRKRKGSSKHCSRKHRSEDRSRDKEKKKKKSKEKRHKQPK